MKGFVRQRRDGGAWTAYWETRDPADGRRRQHTKGGFRTRRLAESHLNVVVGKVTSNEWAPDKPVTVAQLLEDHWLPAQRSRGLRASTLAQYENVVRAWLVPNLGAVKAPALTPKQVQELVDTLRTARSSQRRDGLSQRSAQLAVGVLKAAFAYALETGLLGRNPIAGVRRPSVTRRAPSSWSTDDARSFLGAVRDDRLAALWTLALTRGLRRGELAGLRWSAVDLEAGTLRVVETIVVVNGRPQASTPKTAAGAREVPLDAVLVAALTAHRRAQAAERLLAGEAWSASGYVFTDALGRPLSPDWISERFDQLVAASGAPRITLHGTRHTAASLMLAAGVPVKVVQEMLGHSSPTITLGIYAHVVPSMGRDAGAALSAALLD